MVKTTMESASTNADEEHNIPFTLAGWSSYSGIYHPNNILEDKPQCESSRWASNTNVQPQFLLLKLDTPAIVQKITFGKFHKLHVSNLKEFKVQGGMTPNNLRLLLHSGLRNDDEPETFSLVYNEPAMQFACCYIKITPLAPFKPNFNFSIWYIKLSGITDRRLVADSINKYQKLCEEKVTRLCLKHLRQRGLTETFEALKSQTQVSLEHDELSLLHTLLVKQGNFEETENILRKASAANLFKEYIDMSCSSVKWERIYPPNPRPGMRGGHQMCLDASSDPLRPKLFLLGGWDGTRDLADLWSYDIVCNRWLCISEDTRSEGGPGPRSCHKLCFDPMKGKIYTLGKYIDVDGEALRHVKGDFYSYDVNTNTWLCISKDTASTGGPTLIYDHQMVVDPETQIIYVFGGRCIGPPTSQGYSGLYSYNIESNTWKLLRADNAQGKGGPLRSRIGHSMVLHPDKKLLIFAGQRNKDYLCDFIVYDIASDKVDEICRDSSRVGGPDAGFTQRATLDTKKQEIYVLSGLMRDRESAVETVKNSFWVYTLARNRWKSIYSNDNTDASYWERMKEIEPSPRFAHQLVYNQETEEHFMFGGNPGDQDRPSERLDDLWKLTICRMNPETVLQSALFLVRCGKFKELCQRGQSIEALMYLRTEVSAVTNHSDPKMSEEFRKLAGLVFQQSEDSSSPDPFGTLVLPQVESLNQYFPTRTALFEELCRFYPEKMTQPKENLVDMMWNQQETTY